MSYQNIKNEILMDVTRVEIGLDPKNTEVQLYLISDDLIELEIGQREKYIQAELDKFKDFMCSKIMIS